MQRALSLSLHVLCISSRVLCSVLRVLCLCYASALLFPGKQDGTAAGTPAAARIKASTEAAFPSPRPATRTRRSVRFRPTQYGLGCSVLGRGAEPPQFWVLLIWLEPGISHVTWVHYDATMCLPCFVCSILPVLHFLRFDLCVL